MEHHKPIEESISDVVSAFGDSPVPNPDGVNGITLHFDVDDQIPHQNMSRHDVEFPEIKAKYFGTAEERADPNSDNILSAKNALFHYVVYGHSVHWACGYPNCKNISIAFARFVASNDPHPQGGRDLQAMMLMHELGHNFGLYHGGFWEEKDVNYKPNYLSNMYSLYYWSIPTLDFSRCELPPLDERNLDESAGVDTSCPPGRLTGYFHEGAFYKTQTGVPVDWNRDGDVQDVGVVADINNDGKYTVLHGYDDWSNLKFGPNPLSFDDYSNLAGTELEDVHIIENDQELLDKELR